MQKYKKKVQSSFVSLTIFHIFAKDKMRSAIIPVDDTLLYI